MPAPLLPLLLRVLPMLGRGGSAGSAAASVASGASRAAVQSTSQQAVRGGVSRLFSRTAKRQAIRFRRGARNLFRGFGSATGTDAYSRLQDVRQKYRAFRDVRDTLRQARQPQLSNQSIGDAGNTSNPGPLADKSAMQEQQGIARANLNQAAGNLATALTRLGRTTIGTALALGGFGAAVKRAGDANVEAVRGRSPFSGRIASAIARFDAQENTRSFQSAAATSVSSERFLQAQSRLNTAVRPISDFGTNATNALLTSLTGTVAKAIEAINTVGGWLQRNLPAPKDAGQKAGDFAGQALLPGGAAVWLGKQFAGANQPNAQQPKVAPVDNRMPLEKALANPRWKPAPPVGKVK